MVRMAAMAIAALGLAAPAVAASMWTGVEDAGGTQEECLQHAAGAMRGLQFTVTVNPQAAFGWRGRDGVSLRCIADRRLAVIFVYAATTPEDGQMLLDQLRAAYKAASTPPASAPSARPAAPARPGGGKP